MRRELHLRTQTGAASLVIGLLFLVLLTGVTLFSAQVGIEEQKTAANHRRYVDAFERAERGLEQGFAFMQKNRRFMNSTATGGWLDANATLWTPCADNDVALPCGDGHTNHFGAGWVQRGFTPADNAGADGPAMGGEHNVYFVAQCAATGCADGLAETGNRDFVTTIIGQGFSDTPNDPLRGQSVVLHQTTTYARTNRGPDVPLIAAGSANISGTFTVVPNPNGGGPGVPLSIWSNDDVDVNNSSPQTCLHGDYYQNPGNTGPQSITNNEGESITVCLDCACPNPNQPEEGELISQANVEAIDILDIDGNQGANPDAANFPSDLLAYTFGVLTPSWPELYVTALHETSCDNLDQNSSGLIWVENNRCQIGANTTVGSPWAPVAIVADDVELEVRGGAVIYGLLFSFDNPDKPTVNPEVAINAGAIVYGSIIIDHPVTTSNGGFTVVFDQQMLTVLNNDVNKSAGRVAGGWRDFF